MSQFPIRNETKGRFIPITEADTHRLQTEPAIQEINAKDKGKDRRKYRVRVWDHKTQRECWKVSLKCSKGIPLWVDRGIEIAQKVAIAHNTDQIRRTEQRADYDRKERWEKEGNTSIEDLHRAYAEQKRALGGSRGGWSEDGGRADKAESESWNRLNHFKNAFPGITHLHHLVNYDSRNEGLLQSEWDLHLERMRKTDGSRYKTKTLNNLGTWLKAFLSTLRDIRLLPKEYTIRPYRDLPPRSGEITVKEKVQGRVEQEGIYTWIKTNPVVKDAETLKGISNPTRMSVAAEMWKFMCFSGLRLGEARRLIWDDISFEPHPSGSYGPHGHIDLSRIEPFIKRSHGVCTRKWLTLPMFPEVKEALLALQTLGHPQTGISSCNPQEEVFPGQMKWYTDLVRYWSRNYYRSIGIERSLTSHATRTYAIDHLEHLGWKPQQISCYVGNSQRTRDLAYNSHLLGPEPGLMDLTVPMPPSAGGELLEGQFQTG